MSQQDNDQLLQLPNFNDDDDDAAPVRPVGRGTPWWRRRGVIIIIAVFLLIVLVGGIVFALLRSGTRTTALAYGQVSTGNFVLTVSATGPIQGGTYNVVFSGSGKISEIDVAVGQTVQQGQVLAKLDPTSLQDALNAAQATVLSDQTALTNAENSYGKTVGQSQASTASAQTALNNAQTSLSNTQAQSNASIAAAQTALTNAQNDLTRVQAESSSSVSSARTALSNAQSNLSAVRTQTQRQIATAKIQEDQAIAACTPTPTPTPMPTPTPPPSPTVSASATAAPSATTSTSASVMMAVAATPAPDCIKLAEDQYNETVATANASVTSAENQVTTAQQQLTSAQAQAAANNGQAQDAISTAENSLTSAQAQSNSNNANAQGAVNTAQGQLNSAVASSASSNTTAQGQINSAQSQLNSALVGLQTAQHNLANQTLTAPHAGIVTQINGSVGGTPGVSSSSSSSSTGSGGGTFIQIVDNSALQVVADVDEADTGNLKVGEPVLFTVSAYGNRTFRGTVSAISPNGQTVSNVVTYPVYIDVNMNDLQGVNLLPGMTANVTIDVVERIGVLLIPVSAVNFARAATSTANSSTPLITPDQANVALDQAQQMLNSLEVQQPNISSTDNPTAAYILEGTVGNITVKPVVLGLTDDTEYEVLAGLSSGETIITGTQTAGRGTFPGFNGGSNGSGSGG